MIGLNEILSGRADEIFALLMDAALKGLLITLAAFAICYLLRRSSASLRHLCWTLALGGLLLVPLFGGLLPRVDVPIWPASLQATLNSSLGTALSATPAAPAAPAAPAPPAAPASPVAPAPPAAEAAPAPPAAKVTPGFPIGQASPATSAAQAASAPSAVQAAPTQSAAGPAAGALGATVTQASAADLPMAMSWTAWLVVGWAAIASGILLHMLFGFFVVGRLIRRSAAVETPDWSSLAKEISRRLAIRRSVRVVKSSKIAVPMTWGIRRPVVLLPEDADEWPEERRRCVMIHELTHVKRFDCATQSLATVACALHWFNPFVWAAAKNMRLEREKACDDSVLTSARARASEYATHLLDIARGLSLRSAAPAVAVTMARKSQLEGRVLSILEEDRRRRSRPHAVTSSMLIGMSIILALAAMRPVSASIEKAQVSTSAATQAAEPVVSTAAEPKTSAVRVEPMAPDEGRDRQATDVEARGEDLHVTDVIKRSFNVSPGGSLTIDTDMGNIEIGTSSRNSVEVEVHRRARGAARETDFDVSFDHDGSDVDIVGKRRTNARGNDGINVDFRITVPRRFNLDLNTAGGNIAIADLDGTADVHTSGGNLAFGRIKGSIDAHTSGGNVSIEGSDGNVDVHTSGGNISLGRVGGTVDVSTSGGNISVDEVYGEIDAETSGGQISARISRQPNGDSELRTSGGSITVYLAEGIGLDLDAETSAGYVASDVDVTVNGEIRKDRVRGRINGGGPELVLDTSAGDIHIRRL